MVRQEVYGPVDGAIVPEETAEEKPDADEDEEAPLEEGSPPDEDDFVDMQTGGKGPIPHQGFHIE